MKTKRHTVTFQSYLKGRFFVLLIAILFMLVLSPLLTGFVGIKILLDIFLSIIIISGIYAVSQNKTNVLITVALAIPLLVSTWLNYFVQIPYLMLTGRICGFLCFFFMIIAILTYILKLKEVTVDTIFGSLVAYLLMAIMWSNMYSVIESLHPGSFTAIEGPLQGTHYFFTYYSFVTITTLGYGDITPLTHAACSFSILEAVLGQIYLVVLVAWLVGVYVSQSVSGK